MENLNASNSSMASGDEKDGEPGPGSPYLSSLVTTERKRKVNRDHNTEGGAEGGQNGQNCAEKSFELEGENGSDSMSGTDSPPPGSRHVLRPLTQFDLEELGEGEHGYVDEEFGSHWMDDEDDENPDAIVVINRSVDSTVEEMINNMNNIPAIRYDWSTFAVRGGITTLIYPTQMVQVLMQAGYEPYPPKGSVTLLGRPCLLLPSTGTYLRYIYQVDGVMGLFHGIIPRISQQLVFTYVFDYTRFYLRRRYVRHVLTKVARDREREFLNAADSVTNGDYNFAADTTTTDNDSLESFGDNLLQHFTDVFHELTSKLVAVVVSYPLHVVVVRTIAQFVGRENMLRPSFFGEVRAIYQDFGIMGFYRGLVPKLLGETCQTLAVGAVTYFVSHNAPTIELKSLLNISFSVLISAWTYPFSVVSTTMAVNGSSLLAGQPPIQPPFENWIQCWKELKALNIINRGSSFICRYYTGPTMMASGIKVPTGIAFGPNHLALNRMVLSSTTSEPWGSSTILNTAIVFVGFQMVGLFRSFISQLRM